MPFAPFLLNRSLNSEHSPGELAEELMPTLGNDRRETFANEYLIDLNATRAAIRAGYSRKGAAQRGHELLRNRKVKARISVLKAERNQRTRIQADRVVEELARIAFSNILDFLDFSNAEHLVIDLSKASESEFASIASLRVENIDLGAASTRRMVRRFRIRLHDKVRALQLLGLHLGLFDKRTNAAK